MREATRRVEGDEQQEAGGKQQEHEGSTTTIVREKHEPEQGGAPEGETELELRRCPRTLPTRSRSSRCCESGSSWRRPICLCCRVMLGEATYGLILAVRDVVTELWDRSTSRVRSARVAGGGVFVSGGRPPRMARGRRTTRALARGRARGDENSSARAASCALPRRGAARRRGAASDGGARRRRARDPRAIRTAEARNRGRSGTLAAPPRGRDAQRSELCRVSVRGETVRQTPSVVKPYSTAWMKKNVVFDSEGPRLSVDPSNQNHMQKTDGAGHS